MANYVPFEQLEIGKEYYMYSSYWHRTLGKAKIHEKFLESGTGSAYSNWGQDNSRPFCFGVDDGFYNCMFWDGIPTREEIVWQKENGVRYVAPRMIGGKAYSGGSISGELKELLDGFINKMNQTFKNDPRFKQDKQNPQHYFIWESKLDYESPSDIFITNNGRCDWEMINYVEKHGDVEIHAGEHDGFGWLSGFIDKKMPDGTVKTILYG